jgi:hypothetical protein
MRGVIGALRRRLLVSCRGHLNCERMKKVNKNRREVGRGYAAYLYIPNHRQAEYCVSS